MIMSETVDGTSPDGYTPVRVFRIEQYVLADDLTIHWVKVVDGGRVYCLIVDDELLPFVELCRRNRAEVDVRIDALIPNEDAYRLVFNPTSAPLIESYMEEDH